LPRKHARLHNHAAIRSRRLAVDGVIGLIESAIVSDANGTGYRAALIISGIRYRSEDDLHESVAMEVAPPDRPVPAWLSNGHHR
jgi:hypothetical protein